MKTHIGPIPIIVSPDVWMRIPGRWLARRSASSPLRFPFLTALVLFLFVATLHAVALSKQLGELSKDSTLDVRDLQKLFNQLTLDNEFLLVPDLLPYADVSEDGYLSQQDVTLSAKAILGIPIPVNSRPVTLEPATGSSAVGFTVRSKAIFPKPIDIAALNSNNFYATFAWLFFYDAMPSASQISIPKLSRESSNPPTRMNQGLL